MTHPCVYCERVSESHFAYLRRRFAMAKSRERSAGKIVRTLCRTCGGVAIIDLGYLSYDEALLHLGAIDGASFEHEGYSHAEHGGWGVRWRFDDVLQAAYPREYDDDPMAPYWPMAAEYVHDALAERTKVIVIDPSEIECDASAHTRSDLGRRLNGDPRDRRELEAEFGRVWDTEELVYEFDVHAFRAPYVIVRRKADGVLGSLLFQCTPRFYFQFRSDRDPL